MKNLKVSLTAIFFLCHSLVSAQITSREDLIAVVNEKLQEIAQEKDFLLDEDATSLSTSLSTVPISPPGVAAIVILVPATAAIAVHSVVAFVGGLAMGVASGSSLTRIITYIASNAVEEDRYLLNTVAFVNHYRMKLNYSVRSVNGGETFENSCILFVAVDKDEEGNVPFEIDECDDEIIFPQDEKGILRIGNDGEDFWDEWLWLDQSNVVATGTLY